MPSVIISEGKTTNEAIEKGLKQLNAKKNQVNIKVLESDDKRSFFSILAPRIVKVEMTLKDEFEKVDENKENTAKVREYKVYSSEQLEKAESNVRKFLDEFLVKVSEGITYEIIKDSNGLNVNINGDNTAILIGYRGETLYALQNILVSIGSKELETRVRVILDVAGYKEKREKTLENLAEKVANTVIKTGKSVTLEPMKAYERKIIHSKLQDSKKVKTNSIGEEPKRRIVISLK